MPDHTKLHFAAHLACHTKHGEGLDRHLDRLSLEFPLRSMDFVGEWLAIPTNSYCYLDSDESLHGAIRHVGDHWQADSWQCQHKFRISDRPVKSLT